MITLNNSCIYIMADSGNFLNFSILRKQSEDKTRYDQWRNLTMEEAKQIEAAVLMVVDQILELKQ
jgi:hypothetical protein